MKAFVFALILLVAGSTYADSDTQCLENYAGFFDRDLSFIPELTWEEQIAARGMEIAIDVKQATVVNPQSPIAQQGISASGMCIRAVLDNPMSVGTSTMAEYEFAVIALKNDHSGTYYLHGDLKQAFVAGNCQEFHKSFGDTALAAITKPDFRGGFENGYYTQHPSTVLTPYFRKVLLTADQKFLLTRREVGLTMDNEVVEDLCAFPMVK